jgi:tetratricopeptide (TPR) repeat protein
MMSAPPPSRNSPCPCGSGKRYKQCCGAVVAPPASPAAAARTPEDLLRRAAQLHQAGRLDEAEALYLEATRLEPGNPLAIHYLGVLAMQRGDLARSAGLMRQALAARPEIVDFHTNLGLCLRRLGHLAEAIECHRRAATLDPRNPIRHNNLAIALQEQGRIDEALETFGRALALDPDNAEAHYNRGLAYLVTGDYARGWEEYEWRARCREFAERNLTPAGLRPWRGEALAGRTLLVRREQGHGDMIQFLRFVPALAERAARVFVEAPAELEALARSVDARVTVIEPDRPPPEVDLYVNLMSIPRWLGVTLDEIPNGPPYLRPDPVRCEQWRNRLAGHPGAKVGLVWGGNPLHHNDRNRSCPLPLLAGLLAVPGYRWFSLQRGPSADQLSLPAAAGVTDLGVLLQDYSDTAAAMNALDLVITVDTSAAHLAGALSRPAWVMVPHAPDWRWLRDRDDSPWYPSLRLFRQREAGDWHGVVEAMRIALQEMRR